MKVLVVHRYFWPDTPPYASMLRSIAARWASDGHDVSVFSTQPSYNPAAGIGARPARESVEGVTVIRCRLLPEDRSKTVARLANVVLFCGRLLLHMLSNRGYDVVMAATFPPVAASTTASLGARVIGAKFVYHMQDIYPEIAHASKLMRDGLFFRMLRWLDTLTCHRASAVVVLSEDMAEAIRRRGVDPTKVRIINNFNTQESDDDVPLPAELEKPAGAFRVMFAGNLGRFQALSSVVDAARVFSDDVVRFELLGDGVARMEMEARAGDALGRSVFFHGFRPPAVSQRMLETADLGLVTLEAGVVRYAYPSKVIGCLAAGTPLLVAVEADSELARMVAGENIGFVVPAGQPDAMAESVRSALEDPAGLEEKRRRARTVFQDRFERKGVLEDWSRVIDNLGFVTTR